VFIEPFRVHFDPIIGHPSIPIETYLRLMFLKFRYQLGYELLCREVADLIGVLLPVGAVGLSLVHHPDRDLNHCGSCCSVPVEGRPRTRAARRPV
jgi:hypothetical protein